MREAPVVHFRGFYCFRRLRLRPASRSCRQSAAASMLISVRRPTAISRGPRPSFFNLKKNASEMLWAMQKALIE